MKTAKEGYRCFDRKSLTRLRFYSTDCIVQERSTAERRTVHDRDTVRTTVRTTVHHTDNHLQTIARVYGHLHGSGHRPTSHVCIIRAARAFVEGRPCTDGGSSISQFSSLAVYTIFTDRLALPPFTLAVAELQLVATTPV